MFWIKYRLKTRKLTNFIERGMAVNWIKKLQTRWNLNNPGQVLLVLLVFACTGFTVMFLKKPITQYFFTEPGSNTLFSILYWIFILPVYNVLLLVYGFVFGQFRFFWNFEKKFFKRMLKF